MPATRARKTAAKPKAAPVVEPEELEEEDEELEELEEDEPTETKPATKKSTSTDVTFGVRDLVALIKKKTGEDTDPRAIRTLIRKMARDESGRVNREIKAGNRERYDWSGPNDPEVLAIVEAFKGGELEVEKKAKLDKLKADKAAKAAAKKAAAAEVEEDDEDEAPAPKRKAPAKKATPARRKAKPAPVEEVEDDEELELDEDDE